MDGISHWEYWIICIVFINNVNYKAKLLLSAGGNVLICRTVVVPKIDRLHYH